MHTIIYNPIAGTGRGERNVRLVAKYLDEKGIPYTLMRSEYPGHPTELAKQAVASGCDVVIAAGGDGTVTEVARALIGTNVALGLLPSGTGNDYRRTFDIPADPIQAMERIMKDNRIQVDVGLINGEVTFLNEAGTGFDVSMDDHLLKLKKRFKGQLCFVLSVLMTILEYPFPWITVTVDGEEPIKAQPMIVTIANGKAFGSGMKVAPDASVQDGLFDVMLVSRIARWRVPFLLPKLVSGKLATGSLPFVRKWRAREVILEKPDLSLQVDGNIIPSGDRAVISFSPHRLSLLV